MLRYISSHVEPTKLKIVVVIFKVVISFINPCLNHILYANIDAFLIIQIYILIQEISKIRLLIIYYFFIIVVRSKKSNLNVPNALTCIVFKIFIKVTLLIFPLPIFGKILVFLTFLHIFIVSYVFIIANILIVLICIDTFIITIILSIGLNTMYLWLNKRFVSAWFTSIFDLHNITLISLNLAVEFGDTACKTQPVCVSTSWDTLRDLSIVFASSTFIKLI